VFNRPVNFFFLSRAALGGYVGFVSDKDNMSIVESVNIVFNCEEG
jgi:hypothetical protein